MPFTQGKTNEQGVAGYDNLLLSVLEKFSLCGNHTALLSNNIVPLSNSNVSLHNSNFKLVDLIIELNDVKSVDIVG